MSQHTVPIAAGPDAYYGGFADGREREALEVAVRLATAWGRNDAEEAAAVFVEDGVLILPGGVLERGRPAIRDFLASAFGERFKGTGLAGVPVDVRFARDDVAVLRTNDSILLPGAGEPAESLEVRSSWVVVNRGGGWQLAAYQNSPRGTSRPA